MVNRRHGPACARRACAWLSRGRVFLFAPIIGFYLPDLRTGVSNSRLHASQRRMRTSSVGMLNSWEPASGGVEIFPTRTPMTRVLSEPQDGQAGVSMFVLLATLRAAHLLCHSALFAASSGSQETAAVLPISAVRRRCCKNW